MSLSVFIKMYELYKASKLTKNIAKIQKETYSMLIEIDNKLEDIQNKTYSESENWKGNWTNVHNIRDDIFVTLGNLKVPSNSEKLSQRLENYGLIKESSQKLYEMVSFAGGQIDGLEKCINEQKLNDLKGYTQQIVDFSGINYETSILNAKIIQNNVNLYLTDVLTKLESQSPDYSPNGKLLYAKKWKIKKDVKKLKISAKIGNILSDKFKIECNYVKQLPSNEELLKSALKLKPNSEAKVMCYVTEEADSCTKDIFENFEHLALSIFCYETKTGNLIYNKKSKPNSYFSGYFDPKQKPKRFNEFIRRNSENDLISLKTLNELRLKKDDPALRHVGNISRISSEKYKIMGG